MTRNFLLLNSDKKVVIVLGPQHLRNILSNDILTLDDTALASSTNVRNLGVVFDQDMSFNSHIKQTSMTALFFTFKIQKSGTSFLKMIQKN